MFENFKRSAVIAALAASGVLLSTPASAACWSGSVDGLEYADMEKSRTEAGVYGGLTLSTDGSGVRLRVLDGNFVSLCSSSSSATRCDYKSSLPDRDVSSYQIRVDNEENVNPITYSVCTF
jgi:hypothetical protein